MTTFIQNLPKVQMLWVEGRLSRLEMLSLASFVSCGHPVELFTYGLDNEPPKGVLVRDASEIIPYSKRFRRTGGVGYGSWGPFADMFRFTLLYEHGGIWCDSDMVCLKPLTFALEMPIFFSSELAIDNSSGSAQYFAHANNGAIQVPSKHPLMAACLDKCSRVDPEKSQWAESGPGVVRSAVTDFSAMQYVLHPDIFCPVAHWETTSLLFGVRTIPPTSFAIHFWNEILRWNFFDKNARYDKNSIFERLCSHYLLDDQPA